jgi:16S rRNA processing protein RimM
VHVVVGRVGRPHGIRGALTVHPSTDDPGARFAPGSMLSVEPGSAPGAPGALTVADARPSGPVWIVTFDGIADRGAAESLRGAALTVDAAALPDTGDPEEFYDHQLIGLAAVDRDGRDLGTVSGVLHPPAAPVLQVHRPDGRIELVPFVAAIVPEVDIAHRRLVVAPPDGMFA